MKVLITGGAGFIGSHLVDACLARGDQVVVIDDLSHGQGSNARLAAGPTYYDVDIASLEAQRVLAEYRPQVVFHLAARTSVIDSIYHPDVDTATNICGLTAFAMACVHYDVERFIFTSTGGAIYGEPESNPVPETAPARPLSPYGISKLAGEMYLRNIEANHGLPVRILRLGNVWGPRQDPTGEGGVIARWTWQMLREKPITVFGQGWGIARDFVHVSDVIRALLMAPHLLDSEPVHIATGQAMCLAELLSILIRETGFSGDVTEAPARPGEVERIALDVCRAKTRMGWLPTLGEGARAQQWHEMVEWYRARLPAAETVVDASSRPRSICEELGQQERM